MQQRYASARVGYFQNVDQAIFALSQKYGSFGSIFYFVIGAFSFMGKNVQAFVIPSSCFPRHLAGNPITLVDGDSFALLATISIFEYVFLCFENSK
jgi:hypothetical protein